MAELKMLAIDLGASSGRGIVGRFDGEKLTLEENHRFSNDPVINAGGFNWDILRIYHEIKNSISLEKSDRISSAFMAFVPNKSLNHTFIRFFGLRFFSLHREPQTSVPYSA